MEVAIGIIIKPNFSKKDILIKMFLSSTLMAIFLIYMISFLADKLIYDSSLKILYLFLIVGLSIVVYFLISVLIGSIKFGRKKSIII